MPRGENGFAQIFLQCTVSERHYETLIGNKEMNKIVTKVGET